MIFILTGEKDSGKTRYAHKLLDTLKDKDIVVCGFLSIGKPGKNGQKEFDLFDITNQQTFPLACQEERPGYFSCGRYYFNPTAIEKGEEIIQKAIQDKADLIVIDEVGKCELEGNIWDPAIRKALRSSSILLIVTAIKNLSQVITCYNLTHYLTIDVSLITQEQALIHVQSALKK